jgi:hypothetical protein
MKIIKEKWVNDRVVYHTICNNELDFIRYKVELDEKSKCPDYLGYSVYNSLQEGFEDNLETAIFLLVDTLQVIDCITKLCRPKIKYYRIYAKNSAKERYKAIGSQCEQVNNLINAIFAEGLDMANELKEIVKKYYNFVEIRETH